MVFKGNYTFQKWRHYLWHIYRRTIVYTRPAGGQLTAVLWLSWQMLAMQSGQQVPARRISSIYYNMGLKNGLQSTTLYTIYSLANRARVICCSFFFFQICSIVLLKCTANRGKSLLEFWVTTLLPD